jgi:signal transduction histidine kinase
MRPLDRIGRIKLKLGAAILVAVAVTVVVVSVGEQAGVSPFLTGLIAAVLALVVVQVLAHGMTSPLRQMTAAARAMARGDYSRRVRASSRDEVGELARAFNSMAAELAAADRQRRELIANVSHELRTPITALQGLLENIVDGVADPDPATLRTALGQTDRLGRLVGDLLDVSRLDAGVVPLDRVELDVPEFLAAAVREAEVTAAGAGRDVRFAVRRPAGPVRLSVDADRMHQVLANLLDNAARHSPPGGTVAVGTGVGTGRVVIEVGDDGPGIPADQRATVFERFTRGERVAGADGGTGLGLAIARWIVELHGGTIAVADTGGPGCRIRITLPDPAGVTPSSRRN